MKIRTANYDDLEEIKALCARNGLDIKKINQKIWRELPTIKEFKNIPIGWVLESDNKKIVGVLLNFFMNGHTLKDRIVLFDFHPIWRVLFVLCGNISRSTWHTRFLVLRTL